MNLVGESRFKLTDDATWRDIKGETIVLKLGSGEYYTFNDVGRIAWLGLSEDKSIDEVAQLVVDEYDVSFDKARADIITFASGLVEQGLLHFQI